MFTVFDVSNLQFKMVLNTVFKLISLFSYMRSIKKNLSTILFQR
jgi:hypothetical protein